MHDIPFSTVAGLFGNSFSLQSLLDEIPFAVAVLDPERRMLLLNRAMEGLTGFPQQAARGVPCAHVLRGSVCVLDCPVLERAGNGGPACREGDIVSRDRVKIPVRVHCAPLRSPEGTLLGFIETVTDMRPPVEPDARDAQAYSFGMLVGRSPQMEHLFSILPAIAQSDSPLLVSGETGTGKDALAEAIHQASHRTGSPFIKMHCGALPENLLESELFGHRKGAFPGAAENRSGRLRLADHGTIFLTEIGDLPLSLQARLLAFLEDGTVRPMGDSRGSQVDVRVIAASNRNLEQAVREGRFREDLLFRLNAVRLHLPPLRERGDDIRLLADCFARERAVRLRETFRPFSARALRFLLEYPYPGNVRELKNIVEYALSVCREDKVHPKHLPAYLTDAKPSLFEPETEAGDPPATPAESPEHIEGGEEWANVERRMILEALVRAKGRKSEAAAYLGWGRSTLWRRMKQYGIDS